MGQPPTYKHPNTSPPSLEPPKRIKTTSPPSPPSSDISDFESEDDDELQRQLNIIRNERELYSTGKSKWGSGVIKFSNTSSSTKDSQKSKTQEFIDRYVQ